MKLDQSVASKTMDKNRQELKSFSELMLLPYQRRVTVCNCIRWRYVSKSRRYYRQSNKACRSINVSEQT